MSLTYTILCQLYLKQAGKKQELTVNLTKKYAHKIKHMLLNYLYLSYDIERTEKEIYIHIFALFCTFLDTDKIYFQRKALSKKRKSIVIRICISGLTFYDLVNT